jgi:hypothetical protein
MNPIDFLFQLFSHRLQLSQDDFDHVKTRIDADFEGSTSKIVGFLKSPYLLLLLPFLLPIAKNLLDRLWAKFAPDQDADGDNDIADALAILSRKLLKNGQQ